MVKFCFKNMRGHGGSRHYQLDSININTRTTLRDTCGKQLKHDHPSKKKLKLDQKKENNRHNLNERNMRCLHKYPFQQISGNYDHRINS